MFGEPLYAWSHHARSGFPQVFSEVVATFGLWLVIATVSRSHTVAVPAAVAIYIIAAYWFTSSTSFANPAVTVARCLTDTFAGIRPADVPAFIGAQLAGGTVSAIVSAFLLPAEAK